MASPQAGPATARQIARHGHIAAHLRALLAARSWRPGDLNEAIGQPRSHTGAYLWIAGKAAPGEQKAKRLAKLCDVPLAEMQPRKPGTNLPAVVAPGAPPAAVKPRAPEVLQFTVTADGEARLRLDVSQPAAQAVPLLRMILDHAELRRRLIGEDQGS